MRARTALPLVVALMCAVPASAQRLLYPPLPPQPAGGIQLQPGPRDIYSVGPNDPVYTTPQSRYPIVGGWIPGIPQIALQPDVVIVEPPRPTVVFVPEPRPRYSHYHPRTYLVPVYVAPPAADGPRVIYVIPGCYAGNVPPRPEWLQPGCSLANLTKTR